MKKIHEHSKLLDIKEVEASDIISQQEFSSHELKRPDVILKRRKKSTDTNIRQVIVPEILRKAKVNINGSELSQLSMTGSITGYQIRLMIMVEC